MKDAPDPRDLATPAAPVTRCDLHVHSEASRGNDEWFTRFFGCPESYVEPSRQFDLCRARGMDFVTLTDHDTIDGCLTLIDRPGTFLSEEITAVFPGEDCTIHVLAWNITPDQHAAIQQRRRNVYLLVDYLCEQGIAHGAAHPLLSPSWNLTSETLEKLLLLFPVLERINGLLDARIARDFEHLVERIDAAVLRSWARKHDLTIRGDLDGRRTFTAGSDDHTLRMTGRVFTETPGPPTTAAAFLKAVMRSQGRAVGQHASIEDMAATIQRTSYEHLRRKGLADGRADFFVDLLDTVMGRTPRGPRAGAAHALRIAISDYVSTGHQPDCHLDSAVSVTTTPEAEAQTIERMQQASDGLLGRATRGIVAAAAEFDLMGLLERGRDLVGALVAAGPLLGAADHFGRQEQQVRRVWSGWSAFIPPPSRRVTALFSDSTGHKDGVSTWCEQFIVEAQQSGDGILVPVVDVAVCSGGPDDPYRLIPAAGSYALPFYPSFKLNVPSLMATVRMLWRSRATHVELATPGPMGLIGWVSARLLRLPVTASFHTDIVALGELLGGARIPIAALRKYSRWFYGAADRVRVFSSPGCDAVLGLGVPADRIDIANPRVDPDDFSPRHRDPGIFEELGVPRGGRPVILSVGRISREKNLPDIIDAVRGLQDRLQPAPVLVIVGDGPERARLEKETAAGGFAFFVGHREGAALRRLYSSAQIFAFASRLDTLGLVNLEALASGLPIVIPRGSNVASLLRHDQEAYCYYPGPGSLEQALADVLENPQRSARLAAAGRRFVTTQARAS